MLKQKRFLNALALILVFGAAQAGADVISDTLKLTDTFGAYNMLESAEPGSVTLLIPSTSFSINDTGGATSDTLTISAFTATLASDANSPGPDIGEFFQSSLSILASSNGTTCSFPGLSDCLNVGGGA